MHHHLCHPGLPPNIATPISHLGGRMAHAHPPVGMSRVGSGDRASFVARCISPKSHTFRRGRYRTLASVASTQPPSAHLRTSPLRQVRKQPRPRHHRAPAHSSCADVRRDAPGDHLLTSHFAEGVLCIHSLAAIFCTFLTNEAAAARKTNRGQRESLVGRPRCIEHASQISTYIHT